LRAAQRRIAGQFVCPFIESIPRVTSNPLPANLTLRGLTIELFPEIKILPPFPSERHGIDEILAVGTNGYLEACRQSAQRFNCGGYFHSIVGRGSGGAREFEPESIIAYEHNSPSTGSGVPKA
jgi:hypothetical protein